MPWAQRGPHRYFFRKRKVGGRVVRRSYGRGPEALLAAALDARRRRERETRWAARHREWCRWQTGAAPLQRLIEVSDLLVLVKPGRQQGAWRRRMHGRSA